MPEARTNTFTKTIMNIVVFLYFIGATLGSILVVVSALIDVKNRGFIDTSMFIAYATYLAAPTATAIGFYAWKSKAENLLKIQQSYKEEASSVMQTISQMRGSD